MIDQKVAVITAGGSGMGAGAAKKLAEDGFKVAILSASGKGEALASELGGLGFTGSNLVHADLEAFVNKVLKEYGRIDVVVNSSGHGPKGDIMEISDDDWHLGMDYYLMNAIRMTRLVAPVMVKNRGGTILNISTFAAFEADPTFPTSGVFRAGLASYTKLFADKFAADNLRMNNILPGFIDSLPETEERRNRIPMGRYGHEEEVSSLISYLASDAAAYITAQNIRIDGGLTRGF
ncbi:SDR family oxidoreductase [Curvivirga aplysinae]|uniref:SDR family oxidoreductase n=1 Tax=Curvivirga aplysinae TaxID=2529852 RepID=UPI0012BD6F49|nr:SDR family oxidoreductase [Curvivirga aplysinae]MTI10980.1 SDR family oxidoreductase [Curvivirga aplysinae]